VQALKAPRARSEAPARSCLSQAADGRRSGPERLAKRKASRAWTAAPEGACSHTARPAASRKPASGRFSSPRPPRQSRSARKCKARRGMRRLRLQTHVRQTSRFEPFGMDWQAGTGAGASENGVFLRLPGQWVDTTWEAATLGAEIYYNVARWYEPQTGRYTRVDPLGLGLLMNATPPPGLTEVEAFLSATVRAGNPKFEMPYGYAAQSPIVYYDPDGQEVICGLVLAGLALGKAITVTAVVVSATAAGVYVADWWNKRRRCDPCENDRDAFCKRMKNLCIEKCTEETLPTGTYDGMPFFQCVKRCLESVGCGNYWGSGGP
jgi:hypothetical protein